MQLQGIREGDIIEYDVRGQYGHALVAKAAHTDPATKKRVLTLKQLGSRPIVTLTVTSYQVRDHWRQRRKGKRKANGNGNGESSD
jgi:hypothetical protein